MRRVLILTTSYATAGEGQQSAGVFVADFARELARVATVTVCAPGERDVDQRIDAVTVRRFAVAVSRPLSLLNPARPGDLMAIASILRAGRDAVLDLAAREKFAHVLACWVLPCGYWARVLSNAKGVPYSTWALGSDIWTLGRIPGVRAYLRRVLRGACHCYADGIQLARAVEGISARNCAFLPSSRAFAAAGSVAAARTRPPFRLAYLGRFHPNKGTDLLADALARLDERSWGAIQAIRIAGGGPLEPLLREEIERLRQNGRPVSLDGYRSREQALELFAWADLILIPSRVESIPVVFSDAMQCARPVLAMPVGDLPGLVSKYAVGLIAASVSAGAFADLLRPQNLERAAACAPGTVRAAADFDVGESARRFFDAMEASISSQRH